MFDWPLNLSTAQFTVTSEILLGQVVWFGIVIIPSDELLTQLRAMKKIRSIEQSVDWVFGWLIERHPNRKS